MPLTSVVRIERYHSAFPEEELMRFPLNTREVQKLYAASREGLFASWRTYIPRDVDYFQIMNANCDTGSCNSIRISEEDVVDRATIYPDGELYTVETALRLFEKGKEIFSGKKADIEKFAEEKAELLVVTRSGQVRIFDRERDVILQPSQEPSVWINHTTLAKARALAAMNY